MPRTQNDNPDWATLHRRIEAIYATGRTPFEDAVSDLSSGQPTLFFDESIWPQVLGWLHDACATAERVGPEEVRREIWDRIRTYTGKTLPQLIELALSDFTHPLENRDWGPGDDEDHYSHIDYRYLAQLFLEEMIADARWAARVTPTSLASTQKSEGVQSDLVTVEWVADLERIKPESIRKRIRKYELTHGRLPPWVQRIPGKQRGRMIRWSIYSRQASSST